MTSFQKVQRPGGAGAVWYSALRRPWLLPGHNIKNLHREPEEKDLKADQRDANRRRCLPKRCEINTTGGSVRTQRESASASNGPGSFQLRCRRRRLIRARTSLEEKHCWFFFSATRESFINIGGRHTRLQFNTYLVNQEQSWQVIIGTVLYIL